MRGRFELGFPVIDLYVNEHKITAILDTGFNGELLLPEELIEKLKLEKFSTTDCLSVDALRKEVSLYSTDVKIDNRIFTAEVVSSKSSFRLAGIALFKDNKITLEQRKNLVLIES